MKSLRVSECCFSVHGDGNCIESGGPRLQTDPKKISIPGDGGWDCLTLDADAKTIVYLAV